MSTGSSNAADAERGLVARVGPFEVDVPRSIGYFGGIGLAVAIGLIDPPIGLFIAAVPFMKMLDLERAPLPRRYIAQVLEGMSKPVGGDSQGTIRLNTAKSPATRRELVQGGD